MKGEVAWSHFADILTAIALHRMQQSVVWFPKREVERAEAVAAEEEQRVWDDIIRGCRTYHGRNSNHRRMIIARRMMHNH